MVSKLPYDTIEHNKQFQQQLHDKNVENMELRKRIAEYEVKMTLLQQKDQYEQS